MVGAQLIRGLVLASLAGGAPLAMLAQGQDDSAILGVQDRQAQAWNQHDARAYARLFTEDGDVVNILGWWWKGRPEIERQLAGAFAYAFRDSTLTITEVEVRFLSPAIALAHVRWTMKGAKAPPGAPSPPQEGIQLQVLVKQSGGWFIRSFQNTNSLPPRPFPTSPPPGPEPRP